MNRLKELIDKKHKTLSNKIKMDLCIEIALFHTENNDFEKAFDEYQNLLEISQEENDLKKSATAYRQMGECMLDLQKPLEALNHIKLYLKTAQKIGDLFEIQRAFVTIGRCYLDHTGIIASPTARQASAMKSENAFVKSLQICQQLSEKSNRSTNSDRLVEEIAEMRAVSLFNLGLVNREKTDEKSIGSAENYFSMCCAVSLKHKIFDFYLRAIFQQIDTKFAHSMLASNSVQVRKIMANEAALMARGAWSPVRSAGVPISSSMKRWRSQIDLLEAQCWVVAERFVCAYKKYRSICKRSHVMKRASKDRKMLSVVHLKRKLDNYDENTASNEDQIFIGKLYEELGIPQLAVKHYQIALDRLPKGNERYINLRNRLVTVYQSIGCYKESIPLLEHKLKHQLKNKANESSTAAVSCHIIEMLLDCYLRTGTLSSESENVIHLLQQLDSLAFVTNKLSIQISAAQITVSMYEALMSPSLAPELAKAKEKEERLYALSSKSDSENPNEDNESDKFFESDLSELEISECEMNEEISSESDTENRVYTDCQLEELQAVGKRTKKGKDASFIKRNEKGESLLHVAAINGNLKQVEKLVDQMNHPLDIVDSAGWTPLHEAANYGRTKVVAFLLDRKANIEHTGPSIDCSTAVMEAVHGGNIDTAILLIERGANLWHKNRLGENLGDCVDDWRKRCRDTECYSESEAQAYREIMDLIKEKLGDRYIEWCRQRRGERKSVISYNSLGSEIAPQKESKVFKSHSRRARNDEEESEENVSLEPDNPVQDYVTTMNALKGRQKKKPKEVSDSNTNSHPEAGYVIGDDWLEHDVPDNKSHKRIKEPDYGNYVRGSRKRTSESQDFLEYSRAPSRKKLRESHIKDSPILETTSQSSKDRFDTTSIDLFPSQDVKFNTECSQLDDLFGDDTMVTSTQKSNSSELSSTAKSLPATVTVEYRSVLMKIPLEPGCTVDWLINETMRRFALHVPESIVNKGSSDVKISTENGSLLLPTDLVCIVISDLGPGPVKLLATDITPVTSGLPIKFQHLNPNLLSALDDHLLDLSNQNLSKSFLECLSHLHFVSNVNALKRISFHNNNITDEIINKPFVSDFGTLDFSKFLLHHSLFLEELDFSSNKITGAGFSNLLHSLKSKGLPKLKILNLSFNPIGTNDFCVLSLILKPILLVFPAMEILKLNNCEISNFSEFSSIYCGNQENSNVSLRELDLSNNALIYKREDSDLFFWRLVKDSLRHLSVRGCGKLLVQLEGKNSLVVQFITSLVESVANGALKLTSLDVSDCVLDSDSLHQLSRLFINKDCTVSRIICHSNNILKESVVSWSSFVHSLSQPMCKISQLSIDMPSMESFEDFQNCIYTIREKVQARLCVSLNSVHFHTSSNVINIVKYVLFETEFIDFSDDEIKLSEEEDLETDQKIIHYSKYFVLSILNAFKNRYGKDKVFVEFEENVLKIVVRISE